MSHSDIFFKSSEVWSSVVDLSSWCYLERKLQHFYRYSMTTFPYKKGNYSLFAVLLQVVHFYSCTIVQQLDNYRKPNAIRMTEFLTFFDHLWNRVRFSRSSMCFLSSMAYQSTLRSDYGRDGEVYVTVDLTYQRYTFPAFGTEHSAHTCRAQSQFNKTTWTSVYKCLQVFVESLIPDKWLKVLSRFS